MNAARDLLLFDVGAERFALPLDAIAAVLDAVDVHPVGGLATRGVGVLPTHEGFLSVHSPSSVLGVCTAAEEPLLLMLAHGAETVGLLVDHAEAALAVPLNGLRDLSGMGTTDGVVLGALHRDARWVTLLDAESLVNALLDRRPAHAA